MMSVWMPQHLGESLFPRDEIAIMLGVAVLVAIFVGMGTGICSTIPTFFVYKKLKGGRDGHAFLHHLYWHMPTVLTSFKAMPESHKRLWVG